MCIAGSVSTKDQEDWSVVAKDLEYRSVVAKDQVIECYRRWRLGVVEDDVPVLKILNILYKLLQLLMIVENFLWRIDVSPW